MRYRAYLFDVQGTLMDFFEPVRRAVGEFLDTNRIAEVDAGDFTRAWRQNYFQRVRSIPQNAADWRRVQDLYAGGFGEVCVDYGLAEPPPAVAEMVASSWQRLQPWPDVRPGLAHVRRNAITATLSNTDMNTMIALFKRLDIGMDAIFTAELIGAFKPEPVIYLRALRYLGVAPHEAAMVAAHPYDLEAAAALGLGTVFVSRPMEYGDPALAHDVPAASVGQVVTSVGDIE